MNSDLFKNPDLYNVNYNDTVRRIHFLSLDIMTVLMRQRISEYLTILWDQIQDILKRY